MTDPELVDVGPVDDLWTILSIGTPPTRISGRGPAAGSKGGVSRLIRRALLLPPSKREVVALAIGARGGLRPPTHHM